MAVLFIAAWAVSCEKTLSADSRTVVEIQTGASEFQTASTASILAQVRTSSEKDSPIIIIHFTGADQSAEVWFRNRVEIENGVISCHGLVKIDLEGYTYMDEALSADSLAERFATYAECAHLTDSTPMLLLAIVKDLPASRLFDFAKLLNKVKPPIEFRLVSPPGPLWGEMKSRPAGEN